jgi:ferrous iron transport protein A
MPLSLAVTGRYIILSILGGKRMARKLEDMGLRVGDEIEIIKPAPGAIIISSGETRIGIGVGMANRIYVSRTENLWEYDEELRY